MDISTFCPKSQTAWREWLQENHQSQQAVWLVYYKKKINQHALTWSNAVDEALCFGWVDSRRKPIDDLTFMQFFCKRKPNSTWSKINKEKVQLLIDSGRMSQAGFDSITLAKQNGSWTMLDDVEELIIPADLEEALMRQPGSMGDFLNLSKSARKELLQWLLFAKRIETRLKRIDTIVKLYGSTPDK